MNNGIVPAPPPEKPAVLLAKLCPLSRALVSEDWNATDTPVLSIPPPVIVTVSNNNPLPIPFGYIPFGLSKSLKGTSLYVPAVYPEPLAEGLL